MLTSVYLLHVECTHDAPRPFKACAHLLAAELAYVAHYTGNGMECIYMCEACDKGTPEVRAVCEECRERAKEGGFERMVGTPGIVEGSSALRFVHRKPPPLAHPQLVDARGVPGGDRDRWIGLTAEGGLYALDLDRASVRQVGAVANLVAPELALELHLSRDGRLAAVVQRRGRYGTVIDLETGVQTMQLDRAEYHEEHCAFSVAFVTHGGRDLVVHATAWNRLDISDARTGELLTAREQPKYHRGEPNDPHYLDYFHCGLSVSPDQTWIIDNGWVWAPQGQVAAWRLDRWLTENVWESEDGPTRTRLDFRGYFWDGPVTWLDGHTAIVWGYGEDDPQLDAVQLFDLDAKTHRWFAGVPRGEVIYDRVLVSLEGAKATAWDLATGARLLVDAQPGPTRFHPTAKTYLGFDGGLVSARLCGHHAREPWNTGVIAELVASIARDRTFDELPVLGDALEAAGCTDRELLDHCQQPGEHGDGCWAIDRLVIARLQK